MKRRMMLCCAAGKQCDLRKPAEVGLKTQMTQVPRTLLNVCKYPTLSITTISRTKGTVDVSLNVLERTE